MHNSNPLASRRSVFQTAGTSAITLGGAVVALQQSGMAGGMGVLGFSLDVVLLLSGGGVTAAGILLFLASYLPGRQHGGVIFRLRTLQVGELEQLHEAVRRYAGGAVVPMDKKIEMHAMNPDCFQTIERVDGKTPTPAVVGYMMIYPLKKFALARIMAGDIHGAHLLPEHIVKPRGRAAGCYIGFIAADGMRAKGEALRLVRTYIHRLARGNRPGMFHVCTRPTTARALRLVTEHRFAPVSGKGQLRLNEVCFMTI